MSKSILYRGTIHERTEDAPFMGALIIAADCNNNCQGCFNQHLKDELLCRTTAECIIRDVKQNPFNEGIILGGLEWSEQAEDMIQLIRVAKDADLKVMIYTGLTEEDFVKKFCMHLNGCYVKFGKYDITCLSDNYYSCGVKLASTNQYVKYFSQ